MVLLISWAAFSSTAFTKPYVVITELINSGSLLISSIFPQEGYA